MLPLKYLLFITLLSNCVIKVTIANDDVAQMKRIENMKKSTTNLTEMTDLVQLQTQNDDLVIKMTNLSSSVFIMPGLFSRGTLLSIDHQVTLNTFYGVTTQNWQLLYKATRDGFSSSTFHTLCDLKGPTVTVVSTNKGYIFGGFTKESWDGNKICKNDPTAFLFTVTNPYGVVATFMTKYNGASAVTCDPSWGPIFGCGVFYDLYMMNNTGNEGNTVFPQSYKDTTGKGHSLFTGNQAIYKFTMSDMEVFSLA